MTETKQAIKYVKKVWGNEGWVVNTPLYCGKFLFLNKGKRCSLHYHKNKDETFYILSGKLLMEVNNQDSVMRGGDAVHIAPMTLHRFSGLENSTIAEFSTHHEDSDSYRQEESGDVPKEIMQRYKRR